MDAIAFNIRLYHWKKIAADLRLDSEALLARVDGFAQKLPELAEKIRQQLVRVGLTHKVVGRLVETIAGRSVQCRKILGTA